MWRRVAVFALVASIAQAAPQSPTASVMSSTSNPSEGLSSAPPLALELGIDIHESAAVDKEIDALKDLILPAVEKLLPSNFLGMVQPMLTALKVCLRVENVSDPLPNLVQ